MIDTVALREKVLDLAIRGKLVPQDPNDEPASVLLERIRTQKQQMVKDGKLKEKDIKDDSIIFVGEDNLHYEKFADGSVKCIEDEIPFELPNGWAWTRLLSIIEEKPKRERVKTPREQQMNRPIFTSNYEKYEWLMKNGCTNTEDRTWLTQYIRSDEYQNLYGD